MSREPIVTALHSPCTVFPARPLEGATGSVVSVGSCSRVHHAG
jgi:hypothetical protein